MGLGVTNVCECVGVSDEWMYLWSSRASLLKCRPRCPVSEKPVATGKAVVHGVIMGVEVPFPIDDSSLCSHVIPNCPLKADETEYEYSYSFPILKAYPSVSMFSIRDDTLLSIVTLAACSRLLHVSFQCLILLSNVLLNVRPKSTAHWLPPLLHSTDEVECEVRTDGRVRCVGGLCSDAGAAGQSLDSPSARIGRADPSFLLWQRTSASLTNRSSFHQKCFFLPSRSSLVGQMF